MHFILLKWMSEKDPKYTILIFFTYHRNLGKKIAFIWKFRVEKSWALIFEVYGWLQFYSLVGHKQDKSFSPFEQISSSIKMDVEILMDYVRCCRTQSTISYYIKYSELAWRKLFLAACSQCLGFFLPVVM